MYLSHFGLRELPFRLTPDVDFLFMSKSHSRAKAYMDYTVLSRDGFVVVTGEVGSGKTTLINALVADLPEDVVLAKVFQTQLDDIEFLRAVLSEFGIELYDAGKVELLNAIRDFLIDCYQQGRRVVLVVDEAQNLYREVLEEVRMLSGLETDKEKLLSVILVGQPEFERLLDGPGQEQLRQRVRLRFHLKGLTEAETRTYVEHRLRVAGARDQALVADAAYPAIYEYTGGIPRLINSLCDMALLCAYVDGADSVGTDTVSAAVKELNWVPYRERVAVQRPGSAPAGAQPAAEGGPEAAVAAASGGVAVGDDTRERLGLLFHVVSKLSARMMGKMGVMDQRLREISQELKQLR